MSTFDLVCNILILFITVGVLLMGGMVAFGFTRYAFGKMKYLPGKTEYRLVGPAHDCFLEFKHKDTLFGITIPGFTWSKVPYPYYNPTCGRDLAHGYTDNLYQHGMESNMIFIAEKYPNIVDYMNWYEIEQIRERQRVTGETEKYKSERFRIKNLT